MKSNPGPVEFGGSTIACILGSVEPRKIAAPTLSEAALMSYALAFAEVSPVERLVAMILPPVCVT
jgi:hypothetical protein